MTDEDNTNIPSSLEEVSGRGNNGGHPCLSVSAYSVSFPFI